ncbi:hypothetical protein ACFFIX_19705 [Metabacillus herbersteinensis]|uniref:Uncharacterized protein n=1 Tax=Metabacillus herbersteinensis TaxID=283816 RepID=A0ABV6GJP0_9BACI
MQKVKSIKFNLDNPHEEELYKYANRLSNFAGTVKSLLNVKKEKDSLPVYRSNPDGVIKINF